MRSVGNTEPVIGYFFLFQVLVKSRPSRAPQQALKISMPEEVMREMTRFRYMSAFQLQPEMCMTHWAALMNKERVNNLFLSKEVFCFLSFIFPVRQLSQ